MNNVNYIRYLANQILLNSTQAARWIIHQPAGFPFVKKYENTMYLNKVVS